MFSNFWEFFKLSLGVTVMLWNRGAQTSVLVNVRIHSKILCALDSSTGVRTKSRWLIKMIAGRSTNRQQILRNESELAERIAEKSKMNYHAWNHRCWLVSCMPKTQVIDELVNHRNWAGLHAADNSCFHYRAARKQQLSRLSL